MVKSQASLSSPVFGDTIEKLGVFRRIKEKRNTMIWNQSVEASRWSHKLNLLAIWPAFT
ncbi:MAG: hypothetical protein WBN77_13360 [Desulfobacterales bacterium]|uniref:Uncharacterized protein n=1 Tax=uncultured Desulfobacterium sp. TaxID=201089 RepID=E1YFX0_9BACT|nr:unknown protein [uncultured Desulfobacterium sp.]